MRCAQPSWCDLCHKHILYLYLYFLRAMCCTALFRTGAVRAIPGLLDVGFRWQQFDAGTI